MAESWLNLYLNLTRQSHSCFKNSLCLSTIDPCLCLFPSLLPFPIAIPQSQFSHTTIYPHNPQADHVEPTLLSKSPRINVRPILRMARLYGAVAVLAKWVMYKSMAQIQRCGMQWEIPYAVRSSIVHFKNPCPHLNMWPSKRWTEECHSQKKVTPLCRF